MWFRIGMILLFLTPWIGIHPAWALPEGYSPEGYSKENPVLVSQNWRKKGRKRRTVILNQSRLNRALELIKNQDYLEGTKALFTISQKNVFPSRRTEIRFVLSKALMELKLYHAASFQLLSVIQTGDKKYIYKSLNNLSKIATIIGDSKLLQFAIDKGGERKMTGEYRNAFYYQYGRYQLQQGNHTSARMYLKKVSRRSSVYAKARYHLALSYAEQNENRRAIRAFDDILSQMRSVTDPLRVSALLGKARVYYQAQQWNLSTQFYRQIPKDSPFWHDMLIENSWALLRAGRFRSAMNGFQTLHSGYYQNHYQPESFLLRSIIYMYICKYDEMNKLLDLFNYVYSPIKKWVNQSVHSASTSNYYNNVIRATKTHRSSSSAFPRAIALRIYRASDFQTLHQYLNHLKKEKNIISGFPRSWRQSKIGQYAFNTVQKQIQNAVVKLNSTTRTHLLSVRKELSNLFNQEKYLRYESLRGKREMLKKRISTKSLGNLQIIESTSRDYFVQNGFEFWPFTKEYWLDELGNYHYVGLHSCR